MSARNVVDAGGRRVRVLLASIGILAALLLVAPRLAHGAKSWKECVDGAFAEYNGCLMVSDSWFERKLCDLEFELDVALCSAYILGDIKNAYNEGSGDAS